jgi:mannan endo-1,4-beta-mannosidase
MIAMMGAVVALIAIILALAIPGGGAPPRIMLAAPGHKLSALPTTPDSYLGLYPAGVPQSTAGVVACTTATGVMPSVVPYYSGWYEPFRAAFARSVADRGAVPLVQINPEGISLAAIASGRYDSYLRSYARAVHAYRYPVIVSFGHEMNADWSSWGYGKTSPTVFVAAWRHLVTLFRLQSATNVTWLWTVNVTEPGTGPVQDWWPGAGYVTWVGIDGYFYYPSTMFASLFGPTIAAVRMITRDPILIAETAAVPTAGQPAKLADLFVGVRLYGLLGFVWFDVAHSDDWRLSSPMTFAALRHGARDMDGAG